MTVRTAIGRENSATTVTNTKCREASSESVSTLHDYRLFWVPFNILIVQTYTSYESNPGLFFVMYLISINKYTNKGLRYNCSQQCMYDKYKTRQKKKRIVKIEKQNHKTVNHTYTSNTSREVGVVVYMLLGSDIVKGEAGCYRYRYQPNDPVFYRYRYWYYVSCFIPNNELVNINNFYHSLFKKYLHGKHLKVCELNALLKL